jgi:hypothetical protein
MRVQLLMVTELLEQVASNEKEDFVDAYPGPFLMAMGLLSAEVIHAKSRNETLLISFGATVKHDITQSHPLAGCAFFLQPEEGANDLTMGRSEQCDITVPEPSVSELHCSINLSDQNITVVDLRSKNGTSINMKPLPSGESAILADEDILTLGRYSFQIMAARTLYSELKYLQLVQK